MSGVSQGAAMRKAKDERRTGNVLVQQGILIDDIVDQALAVLVEDEDFPLHDQVRQGCNEDGAL